MESCVRDIIKDTTSRACVLQLLSWPCQHIPRIVTELDVGRPDIAARLSKIPQKNHYCVSGHKLLLVLIGDEILGISWMCVGSQTSVLLCMGRAGPHVGSYFLCVWALKLPLFQFEFHLSLRIRLSSYSGRVSDAFLLPQMPLKKDIIPQPAFIAKCTVHVKSVVTESNELRSSSLRFFFLSLILRGVCGPRYWIRIRISLLVVMLANWGPIFSVIYSIKCFSHDLLLVCRRWGRSKGLVSSFVCTETLNPHHF